MTLLTSGALVLYFCVFWYREGGSFPVLARRYLWASPFLPLVPLFSHNIDHDRFSPPTLLIPTFVMLALLALSLANWSHHLIRLRFGSREILLGVYAVITLVQVPLSVDPLWSLFTWSWSVPGYCLFLLAGRFTTVEDLTSNRFAFLAVLGYLAINLSLIGYGLFTGRAETLFMTRNFGSFYASTAMLLFLTLFGGLAWLGIRSSRGLTYIFFLASGAAVALSLSRTALMVVPLYGAFLLRPGRTGQRGRLRVVLLTTATAILGVTILAQYFDLDTQLFEAWGQRLNGGRLLQAYMGAREVRVDEFAVYHERIIKETMFVGWGFGVFRWFSPYADAHNLFITEAFENGLMAAIILFGSFAIPRAIVALTERDRWPLAASLLCSLLIAQLTGGALSNRAPGQYYSAMWGWVLFFLVGCLAAGDTRSPAAAPAAIPSSRTPPVEPR